MTYSLVIYKNAKNQSTNDYFMSFLTYRLELFRMQADQITYKFVGIRISFIQSLTCICYLTSVIDGKNNKSIGTSY